MFLDTILTKTPDFEPLLQSDPGVVFINISPILIIKFMTFVLVKIGLTLVFTRPNLTLVQIYESRERLHNHIITTGIL